MSLAHGRRRILSAWLFALLLPAGAAEAGGPLILRSNGLPFVWSTAGPVQYRTDDGPLSASVSEAQALTRVDAMFDVWQNVASSNISYDQIGLIAPAGAYAGGDVDSLAEFEAVQTDCQNGGQSPIVYDGNGSIIRDLGMDEESVIGFAGPCALNATQIVSGQAVMNGLFQDGVDTAPNPELSADEFDAAFIHEFGHFSGLDHSQINVSCQSGCGADDQAGLPTMFPLLVVDSQNQLSIDDVAWISRLYPQAGAGGFAATHGTITGVVFFSDGESHAQFVNVIARQVNTGGNQDRRSAASAVSGYKFRIFIGNPIIGGGDTFGSTAPGDIGRYEISVPPGNYTVGVETIAQEFTGGSSVGGPIRIPMPGMAPAPIGPINVTAGATSSGNDITLIGSDPRFDQFEGP
ncbi:MAG: hypothetical protein ACREVI_14045 [Steroidobacteraceae bacterium]